MSDTHTFHNKELTDFILVCDTENLTENDLLTLFKEDITVDNLVGCTNEGRRKRRDFIDKNYVECGKGSGASIKLKLNSLIKPSSSADQSSLSCAIIRRKLTLSLAAPGNRIYEKKTYEKKTYDIVKPN